MQDNSIILWDLEVLLNFFYLVVWTEGVTLETMTRLATCLSTYIGKVFGDTINLKPGLFSETVTASFCIFKCPQELKPQPTPPPALDAESLIADYLLIFLNTLDRPTLTTLINNAYEKYTHRAAGWLFAGFTSQDNSLAEAILVNNDFSSTLVKHIKEKDRGWIPTSFNTALLISLLDALKRTITNMNILVRMATFPGIFANEAFETVLNFDISKEPKQVFDKMCEIQDRKPKLVQSTNLVV